MSLMVIGALSGAWLYACLAGLTTDSSLSLAWRSAVGAVMAAVALSFFGLIVVGGAPGVAEIMAGVAAVLLLTAAGVLLLRSPVRRLGR